MRAVIAYILESCRKAQAMVDQRTVAMAKVYKDDPFLANFPVPYASIDDLKLDFKFAIKEEKVWRQPSLKHLLGGHIADKLENILKYLPQRVPFSDFFDKESEESSDWEKTVENLIDRIEKFVGNTDFILENQGADLKKGLDIPRIKEIVMREVQNELAEYLVSRDGGKRFPSFEKLINSNTSNPWEDVEKDIFDLLDSVIFKDKGLFQVIVDTEELANMDPSSVSSMHLCIKMSKKEWTQIEVDGGETFEKLDNF